MSKPRPDAAPTLDVKAVAEIRAVAVVLGDLAITDVTRLCDSHEALRAALAQREEKIEELRAENRRLLRYAGAADNE